MCGLHGGVTKVGNIPPPSPPCARSLQQPWIDSAEQGSSLRDSMSVLLMLVLVPGSGFRVRPQEVCPPLCSYTFEYGARQRHDVTAHAPSWQKIAEYVQAQTALELRMRSAPP